MTSEVEIYQQPGFVAKYDDINEYRDKLQNFESQLDKKPVQTVTHKEGYKYVPIDILETELTKYFFGLWSWVLDPHPIIVANEIIYTGILKVFHPVIGIWIERSGTGAAQIRMKKDSDITDIGSKIKTALQMDAPHAASEAFKNACAKFGKRFGKGLRRDYKLDYSGFNIKIGVDLPEEVESILMDIEYFTNPDELLEKADNLKTLKGKYNGRTESYKKIIAKAIQVKYDSLVSESING